jgi:hypothetical protein
VDSINIMVSEMTHLRYLMPLVIEGKKRGLLCRLFYRENRKYNNPVKFKPELDRLSGEYGMEMYHFDQIKKYSGTSRDIFFLLEGVCIDVLSGERCRKNVVVAGVDFNSCYHAYADAADLIFFPNEFIAKHYGKVSDKNVYVGSPKYDIKMDKQKILKDYGLKEDKKSLIVFPALQDLTKMDLVPLYNKLREMGYAVIVKTRGKDSVPKHLRGDAFFEDYRWFPHSTMELIFVSDIVINFDSAAVKECVMWETPLVNYSIKTEANRFIGGIPYAPLYDYEYCVNFKEEFDGEKFTEAVKRLSGGDFSNVFKEATQKYLFENQNVSAKILDIALS